MHWRSFVYSLQREMTQERRQNEGTYVYKYRALHNDELLEPSRHAVAANWQILYDAKMTFQK